MSDIESMSLFVKHFSAENDSDVQDIRSRVIPALEREKELMYDLYNHAKSMNDSRDAEDYLLSYRKIGRTIGLARSKTEQMPA